MAKPAKIQQTDTDQTATECVDLLLWSIRHLRRILDAIDRDLDSGMEGVHVSVARESARIAVAIGSLTGELRAREKAERRALELTSPSVLLRALRVMSPEDRDYVLSELAKLDDTGSVLA